MASARRFLHASWATAVLFLANGAAVGAWVVHIPERAHTLHLNAAELGTTLLAGGAGAVAAMPMAAALIARWGSRRVCAVAGSVFPLAMAAAVLSPHRMGVAMALLLFGLSGATMDIAMNAQAVLVEGERRRPLLSSFHGIYSLGGFLGSAATSAALARGLPSRMDAGGTAAVLVMAVLVAQRSLLPDALAQGRAAGRRLARPNGRLLALGMLVFAAMVTEGAVADWSALFLRSVRGYGAGAAGMGFAGFSAAMLLGRLLGDRVVMRIGEPATLRAGGLLAVLGLLLILLRGETVAAVTGFGLLGIGIANCSPVLYRAAAQVKGLPTGVGLATSVGIGYAGLLVGPPLLGYAGRAMGLPSIFVVLAILCGALAAAAPLVRRA